MHNIILSKLTGSINRGIVYGLIIAVSVFLLIKTVSFIWQKLFAPFFEVKVIKKKKLTPLIKEFSFGLIFIYLFFQILKFVWSPDPEIQFLLGQSLIVFCLFLLFLQLGKINFLSLKSKIISFIETGGLKITAGAVLSVFVLINILTFCQKLLNRPSGPNVILIVSDALRADHLGCYGYKKPTSPKIDKFAADALVFEKAMSNAPWTKPSMGSIFTSLYPHEHKAFYLSDNLSDECLTLAEIFRNKNYATFAIQTNLILSKKHNFQQGFLHYFEMPMEKAEEVTNSFNIWIERNKKTPFFAYLHYMDTHVPYNAPQELNQIFKLKDNNLFMPRKFNAIDVRILSEMGLSTDDKKNLVKLYDEAIKYFDFHFEKIIDNLKKLGILDKTIIILTSDHGEEFWEHDGFEHGHSLYNEVLHVPLIIKYSSKLPVKRIKYYVHLLDLVPTILTMTGIKNDFDLNGKDLIPSVLNNKKVNDKIFFEGLLHGPEKKAVLKDGWKLVENTDIKNKDAIELLGDLTKYKYPEHKSGFELYNINQDFFEKFNLINKYPQITNKLKRLLLIFRTSSLNSPLQKKTKLKEKLEDLKSLGYIK